MGINITIIENHVLITIPLQIILQIIRGFILEGESWDSWEASERREIKSQWGKGSEEGSVSECVWSREVSRQRIGRVSEQNGLGFPCQELRIIRQHPNPNKRKPIKKNMSHITVTEQTHIPGCPQDTPSTVHSISSPNFILTTIKQWNHYYQPSPLKTHSPNYIDTHITIDII